MSEELKGFYIALQKWIDDGLPEENVNEFSIHQGICHNLSEYFGWKRQEFDIELTEQFMSAGLDALYPFGGYNCYNNELNYNLIYRNRSRLEWIKEHAQ